MKGIYHLNDPISYTLFLISVHETLGNMSLSLSVKRNSTSKGFNIVRICLWRCVLFLKWLYYEISNFENFLCINISYYQDLCHIEKIISFFFFLSSQTDWRSQRKAVPKNFPITSLRQTNLTWPFLPFFFFLTSILTHFKTWQTKKTWKKVRWKSVRWLMMRYHVKYCYSKRNIIDRVHSSFYKGLKHLLKKVKSIQNII